MGQQPRKPSQSGDKHPIDDAAATATTAQGDDLNSIRGDEINPSPPPNSELVGQPAAGLSAAQQILPVTAAIVSESVDVVDAPNVASPTTESRPPESHETFLQGADPTGLANPALIVRTSATPPFSTPFADANAPPPLSPSSPPSLAFPTRSNTEFIASFPQTTTTTTTGTTNSSMLFIPNDAGAAHRRRSMANTPALTEYEADLTSKDRLKQKEAVRAILASKIRTDWSFPDKVSSTALEPSEDALPETDDPAEQLTTWVERADWLSELSESEDSDAGLAQTSTNSTSGSAKAPKSKKKKINPFRFDSPDGVGEALRRSADRRKLHRQRKLQEELAYNEGLRCFTARRNAWTNARIVRRPRCPPTSPISPSAEKPPAAADDDGEAILDTLVPIAAPLLPPSTPMRRNITSRAHSTIYDKVVIQSQTPMCPINLQTVVSSCVDGWKRDGEWPPRGTEPEAAVARRRGDAAGQAQNGVWKRSLQKVFGRGA
ncbi:hypothetical protein VC83_03713 [Pseudogymnoascus destructans]|uniref:Gag1-like clamp domain-containing protein n=2 Tax=Pseudogymnoascus destructans TaxID=655981 RepID=L8G4D9_PSED2|nr:uncharacterized protein VC83_03713 [Pseudogymnoascus destructans]ELR07664.1 hypothetical protein GMDG_02686 [Pseudogymnoascus destructans 20631-21]OAF59444.1 hypothetical protein VC83_03713 [Pseudogymnoascus destructans]